MLRLGSISGLRTFLTPLDLTRHGEEWGLMLDVNSFLELSQPENDPPLSLRCRDERHLLAELNIFLAAPNILLIVLHYSRSLMIGE